jgi:hydrogenase-4 membrane subunit HyfE
MWMMQVAVNQVVKVITVGNALMCTAGTVYMSLVMSTTLMTRRTSIRILPADFKHVFLNVIEVHVMQVAIMQIIGVVGMSNSHMAAGESVLMAVPLILVSHRYPPGWRGILGARTDAEQFVSG